MIAGHSNISVDVNALRLIRRLLANNKSTEEIYRLLPETFETILFRGHDYHPDDKKSGIALRSTPNNQPDPLTDFSSFLRSARLSSELESGSLKNSYNSYHGRCRCNKLCRLA